MDIKLFKSLGNVVNKYFKKRTNEEIFFSQKFTKFYELKDYLFCYQMIEEGYKPTKEQHNKLDYYVLEKLRNNEYHYDDIKKFKCLGNEVVMELLLNYVPTIEYNYRYKDSNKKNHESPTTRMLSKNIKLDKEDFILEEVKDNTQMVLDSTNSYLEFYKKFYIAGLNNKKEYCKHSELNNKQKRDILTKYMYINLVLIKAGLLLPEQIQQLNTNVKQFCKFTTKHTASEFQSSSYHRLGKQCIEDFIETLEECLKPKKVDKQEEKIEIKVEQTKKQDNPDVLEEKSNLLRQLKGYNVRNKTLSEEIKDLFVKQEYSIENLPIAAQNVINNMQEIVNDLNTEETTKFLNERLPVILKKYFSIDEEYRARFKSVEGFTAEELLLQSLENIQAILVGKKEDNTRLLLSDLSVENRKLKMHKHNLK